ncbi:MAG: diacylglycerol kinase [Rhodobacteraceae bacterium]|nr:diacylglycerol kinase [Paracoccaceae bacterium]
MADPRPKPPRKTGIAHFFAAASYSIGGLRRLTQESAFRQELLAAILLAALYWVLGATAAEYLAYGLLVLALIAVEALNTAIECLVDHLAPDWQTFARDAKDLGSLAVMCMLIAHGLLLAYILLT